MKLLCCGDSLVNGFPFPRSFSFPSIIADETGIEVRNIGINGITAADAAYYFKTKIGNHRSSYFDAVLISCGSNDFMLGMSGPGDVCSDVETMCALSAECGIRQIYICSPPLTNPEQASGFWMPGVPYEKVNEDLKTYAGLLKNLVSGFRHAPNADITFIDIQKAYQDYGRYHDGVHPTKAGYRFIAETIISKLTIL